MNYRQIGVFLMGCCVLLTLMCSSTFTALIICMSALCIIAIITLASPPEQSASNSSGKLRGRPPLIQDNVSAKTSILGDIDKGAFGQVRQGLFNDKIVAVKAFSSTNQESFKNELQIYETIRALNHDNILSFITSEIHDQGEFIEYWIMTEFHERGSLHDYLERSPVDETALIQMCLSIVKGIEHLHTNIDGKPPIAHRDIKSNNILMKTNNRCVIADFGLALRSDHISDFIKVQVGTRRYMSPEVLKNTLKPQNFNSFKAADMYSLSLVYWEICQRCEINGIYGAYTQPFAEFKVTPNPTIEEMRKVVCVNQQRPSIPEEWMSNEVLQSMQEVLENCWLETPSQRSTAQEVLNVLINIERSRGP